MGALRNFAKCLALTIPPIRNLYERVLALSAENAVLRKRFAAADRERAALSARAVAANAEVQTLREKLHKQEKDILRIEEPRQTASRPPEAEG